MAQTPEWVIAGVLFADALEALGVRYMFAGGVASIIHGENRVSVQTGQGRGSTLKPSKRRNAYKRA